MEGYRWWPAAVQDPREHPEVTARGNGGKERLVVVRFHQTHDLAALPTSKVMDFETHLAEKSTGGKKSGGFALAVAAAKQALREDGRPRERRDDKTETRTGTDRIPGDETETPGDDIETPGDDIETPGDDTPVPVPGEG